MTASLIRQGGPPRRELLLVVVVGLLRLIAMVWLLMVVVRRRDEVSWPGDRNWTAPPHPLFGMLDRMRQRIEVRPPPRRFDLVAPARRLLSIRRRHRRRRRRRRRMSERLWRSWTGLAAVGTGRRRVGVGFARGREDHGGWGRRRLVASTRLRSRLLLLEGDGGFLPLTTGEGRRDERIVARLLLLLLLRERDALLLAHPVAILVRISLLLLLLLLPLRLRRRRGLVQAVLFALLLLEREHAVGGFALDLLLYKDLVLDRAVQFGEIGLLSVLEFGEGVGRLGRRLEARSELLLLPLWDASIRWLAHVRQGGRVERWRMLLLLVVVGTCPECERFRTVPRRSVVARHSDGKWRSTARRETQFNNSRERARERARGHARVRLERARLQGRRERAASLRFGVAGVITATGAQVRAREGCESRACSTNACRERRRCALAGKRVRENGRARRLEQLASRSSARPHGSRGELTETTSRTSRPSPSRVAEKRSVRGPLSFTNSHSTAQRVQP